jgi:GT2 family glycosyltransferase
VPSFSNFGIKMKYMRNNENSLTVAKNIGVFQANGDMVFFLDDDVVLDDRYIEEILKVYQTYPQALGVQGQFSNPFEGKRKDLDKLIRKIFFLSYTAENTWKILTSGEDVFPDPLTKTIACMRLSGVSSYKRTVFMEFKFDEKLKRWAFLEDKDFSYRVFKKYPNSLYMTPNAIIHHNMSDKSRLSPKMASYMIIVHNLYFHYKNIERTPLTTLVLYWSMLGRFLGEVALLKRQKNRQFWHDFNLLLRPYVFAFRHLRSIAKLDLDFFNNLMKQEENS